MPHEDSPPASKPPDPNAMNILLLRLSDYKRTINGDQEATVEIGGFSLFFNG